MNAQPRSGTASSCKSHLGAWAVVHRAPELHHRRRRTAQDRVRGSITRTTRRDRPVARRTRRWREPVPAAVPRPDVGRSGAVHPTGLAGARASRPLLVGDRWTLMGLRTCGDRARQAHVLAAASLAGTDQVAALRTAALVWGLPVSAIPHKPEFIRSPGRSRPSGTRVRFSRLTEHDVTRHRGIWVTSLVRTAVDIALDLPVPESLITLDAALQRGVPPRTAAREPRRSRICSTPASCPERDRSGRTGTSSRHWSPGVEVNSSIDEVSTTGVQPAPAPGWPGDPPGPPLARVGDCG